MKTDDKTLIEALLILASDIQCEDGVAVACIVEAANRLRELTRDDMVLLPREPTVEMIDCFCRLSPINESMFDGIKRQYKAMIKAYEEGK